MYGIIEIEKVICFIPEFLQDVELIISGKPIQELPLELFIMFWT